jgi:hypothetical protein
MTVWIEAEELAQAEELRDEIVGAVEDNRESGYADADATCSDLELDSDA